MGAVAVTGSSYILIVVPIVAFVAMFFWLGLVFYADSHPGWKPRRNRGHASAPADAQVAPEARSPAVAPVREVPVREVPVREVPVGAGR